MNGVCVCVWMDGWMWTLSHLNVLDIHLVFKPMSGHEMKRLSFSFSNHLSLSFSNHLSLSLSLSHAQPPWAGGGAILGSTPHPPTHIRREVWKWSTASCGGFGVVDVGFDIQCLPSVWQIKFCSTNISKSCIHPSLDGMHILHGQ